MIGHHDSTTQAYRCGRRKQQGHDACTQPAIVSYAVEKVLTDWLQHGALTVEHPRAARDRMSRANSISQDELSREQSRLSEELTRMNRRIENLLTALQEGGWTREVETRLNERRLEKAQIEAELQQVEQRIEQGQVALTDEVHEHISQTLTAELNSGNPSEVRALLRHVIRRGEIQKGWLTVRYVPPLQAVLSSPIQGYDHVPPREFESRFWP